MSICELLIPKKTIVRPNFL